MFVSLRTCSYLSFAYNTMPLADFNNKTTYSHADMWLLLRDYQVMDHVRKNDPVIWAAFIDLVEDQTANAYPTNWSTASTMIKMADDLGSYKDLSMIWAHIEEAYDYEFNFCELEDIKN